MDLEGSPLQIVADVPTDKPALGFEAYALAISHAIRSGEPPQFTIGLYGRWGTGKSSLLQAIYRILSEPGYSDVIPVELDAWRHQRAEQIVIPLLHAVMKQSEAIKDESLTKAVIRVIRAIALSLEFKLPYLGTVAASKINEALNEEEEAVAALDSAFAQPFEDLKEVGNALEDRRFAILVDDLDRCTADTVVSVLEAINVITDVSGFVFVLALDYGVLVRSVENKYPGVSGHDFIEKIVQLPFRIPRLNLSDDSLIKGVLPNHLEIRHLKDIPTVETIIDLAFEANPRAVKRFVNALGLLTRIIEIRGVEVDRKLLAVTLGGELRWPEEFEHLRAAAGSGDEDPLGNIRSSENEGLKRFASALLSDEIDAGTLDRILRLTAAFVPTEEEDEEPKVAEPGLPAPEARRPRRPGR